MDKKKGFGALIIAKVADKMKGKADDNDGCVECAQAILDAVESKDAEALATALKDFRDVEGE